MIVLQFFPCRNYFFGAVSSGKKIKGSKNLDESQG
jgi:hypothetical protein